MSHDDKSDEALIKRAFPGSTSFKPNTMCPQCGWTFSKGLTDPSGEATGLIPDTVTVCGECLAILKFNNQLKPEIQTPEMIASWPSNFRKQVKNMWALSFLSKQLGPSVPEEPQ